MRTIGTGRLYHEPVALFAKEPCRPSAFPSFTSLSTSVGNGIPFAEDSREPLRGTTGVLQATAGIGLPVQSIGVHHYDCLSNRIGRARGPPDLRMVV